MIRRRYRDVPACWSTRPSGMGCFTLSLHLPILPANRFDILLRTLVDHLSFCLQPVIKGMAILPAMLLIQRIGPFRDARMEMVEMFIRLVSIGGLMAPWFDRISRGLLRWS